MPHVPPTSSDRPASLGSRLFTWLGLAVLVLSAGQLASSPDALILIAGFLAIVVVPVIAAYGIVRVVIHVLGAIEPASRREQQAPSVLSDCAPPDRAD